VCADYEGPSPLDIVYPSLPEVFKYKINKARYVYAGCNRCFCVLEGKPH
jgi:hypothetical protein